jgi:cell division septum initiation protein DivIVA
MATSFTVVKKGYEPKEVLEYIGLLEKELGSYKDKEQFISQALVGAQASAKQIVEQAEAQAVKIEKDALIKLDNVRQKITDSKEKLNEFQKNYYDFMNRFTTSFNDQELNQLFTSLDAIYTTLEVETNVQYKDENIEDDTNIED